MVERSAAEMARASTRRRLPRAERSELAAELVQAARKRGELAEAELAETAGGRGE